MRKYILGLGALAFLAVLAVVPAVNSPALAAEIPANVTSTPSAAGVAQFRFQGLGSLDAGMGVTALGVPVFKAATANDNVAAAGAVSLKTVHTRLNTTSTPDVAITLADGVEGQEKTIVLETKGGAGNFVLTPGTAPWGYTTITFDTVGDAVILKFLNGKWAIVSNQGCTLG